MQTQATDAYWQQHMFCGGGVCVCVEGGTNQCCPNMAKDSNAQQAYKECSNIFFSHYYHL